MTPETFYQQQVVWNKLAETLSHSQPPLEALQKVCLTPGSGGYPNLYFPDFFFTPKQEETYIWTWWTDEHYQHKSFRQVYKFTVHSLYSSQLFSPF